MNRPFKTIRHLLLLLATAAAALCPGDAWADQVTYLLTPTTTQTVDATQITSTTTTIDAGYPTHPPFYYVSGNVTINGDLTVLNNTGPNAPIILCDGASLTITGKIITSGAIIGTFCQSTGSSMGQIKDLLVYGS